MVLHNAQLTTAGESIFKYTGVAVFTSYVLGAALCRSFLRSIGTGINQTRVAEGEVPWVLPFTQEHTADQLTKLATQLNPFPALDDICRPADRDFSKICCAHCVGAMRTL